MTKNYDRLPGETNLENQKVNGENHEAKQESKKLISGERVQVEQIINRIIGNSITVKYLCMISLGILPYICSALLVTVPIFAGLIPYTEWECVSDKCHGLLSNHTKENLTESEFYIRKTMCSYSLQQGHDFKWTATKTSYATHWNLICDKEYKGRNLMSFFFIGAFLGVLTGTTLFDNLGRKNVTAVLLLLVSLAALANGLVNNYTAMLVLRVVQGFGCFIVLCGIQLMTVEFTPTGLRNIATVILSSFWTVGTYIATAMCYLIQRWDHMFLAVAGVIFISLIPLLLLPESPRFQLIKGREIEAKATFKKMAKIFNNPIDIDGFQLEFREYQKNYLCQLKDFIKYPQMGKNTVLTFFCYMFLSAISYSLIYGWGSLGVDVFASVVISATIGLSASFTGYKYFLTEWVGRRKALSINFTMIAVLFLVGMIQVKLPKGWTLTQVMLMLSFPFMSSCWTAAFLLTSELAPTSHRGMIVCMNSAAARIGAFMGPYVSLLYNELDTQYVLAVLALGPIMAAGLALLCPETARKPIPSTPEEVGRLSDISDGEEKEGKVN